MLCVDLYLYFSGFKVQCMVLWVLVGAFEQYLEFLPTKIFSGVSCFIILLAVCAALLCRKMESCDGIPTLRNVECIDTSAMLAYTPGSCKSCK